MINCLQDNLKKYNFRSYFFVCRLNIKYKTISALSLDLSSTAAHIRELDIQFGFSMGSFRFLAILEMLSAVQKTVSVFHY